MRLNVRQPIRRGPRPTHARIFVDATGRVCTHRFRGWTIEALAATEGNYLKWMLDRDDGTQFAPKMRRKALILLARRHVE